MKSIKEISRMLVSELAGYMDEVSSIHPKPTYYNQILGDTSFLLAGLLQSLLKNGVNDWEKNRWSDDSLITEVLMNNHEMHLEGVMIWGVEDVTKQWTSPFSFTIRLTPDRSDFERFTFLFCDVDQPDISYETFKDERDFWNKRQKNWKYRINSKDND